MGLTIKIPTKAQRRKQYQKSLFLIPFIFTFANAVCGLLSIINSLESRCELAALFIFLAVIMDGCDGRVARALGVTSSLGMELDSLCDAISFCLAPVILLYRWKCYELGTMGLIVLMLYMSAGLLRLARFNIIGTHTSFFKGLPTTMAAFFITQLVLYQTFLEKSFLRLFIHGSGLLMLITLVGILLISSFHYPSLKQQRDKRMNIVCFIMAITSIGATIAGYPFFLMGTTLYIFSGLMMSCLMSSRRWLSEEF